MAHRGQVCLPVLGFGSLEGCWGLWALPAITSSLPLVPCLTERAFRLGMEKGKKVTQGSLGQGRGQEHAG